MIRSDIQEPMRLNEALTNLHGNGAVHVGALCRLHKIIDYEIPAQTTKRLIVQPVVIPIIVLPKMMVRIDQHEEPPLGSDQASRSSSINRKRAATSMEPRRSPLNHDQSRAVGLAEGQRSLVLAREVDSCIRRALPFERSLEPDGRLD